MNTSANPPVQPRSVQRGLMAALLGWPGIVIAAAWGFAEATLFFIIPDLVLTLAAAFSVRRSLLHVVSAIIGGVLGGLVMFGWASKSPQEANRTVASVPLVRMEMFERVESHFERAGVWGLCLGPTSGIPYKVYAVRAPAHAKALHFGLVSIPARAERLFITWAQFALLGVVVRRLWPRRADLVLACVFVVYWLVAYGLYFHSIPKGL